ncbi:MAG: DUF3089 domain-containing protein [Candidatus Adiutrix sp.]|jgi:hypothetical protein|nr:DUF3089 domain-containing protein [Candidatus Adiutrix sp.]
MGRTAEDTNSDYSDPDNWLVLPERSRHDADVIYFHPTTYEPKSSEAPLISELGDEGMRAGARQIFRTQATAFETCADIFAPFYRQVNFTALEGAFQELLEMERGAARASVFLALDYYFEHHNKGRPFFLAGHSQGSSMLACVLDEYMKDRPEPYGNMIAAYMLGKAPVRGWLAANPHIKAARGADDTGVVISWNTEGPGNAGKYSLVVPEGSVCINPLNWHTDETYAGMEENLGSLVPDGDGGYKVVEGVADARVDIGRGSVICESVDPAVYAMPGKYAAFFGPESYHGWDYEFYYMNIRENAALRLDIFLTK